MTTEELKPTGSSVDQTYLQEIIEFVNDNLDNPEFGVSMLSRHMAMSLPVLYRRMKAITNLSVNNFIKTLRLQKAAQMLEEMHLNVHEVASAVGYYDRKYFSQEFKKTFGKTPRAYIHETRQPRQHY